MGTGTNTVHLRRSSARLACLILYCFYFPFAFSSVVLNCDSPVDDRKIFTEGV